MLLVCDKVLAVTKVPVSLVVEPILSEVVMDITSDVIVERAVALFGWLRMDETSDISELSAAAAEDSALKAELRDSEGGTLVTAESSPLLLAATFVMVDVVRPPGSDDPRLLVTYIVEVDDGSSFDMDVVGYDIVSVSRALIRTDRALGGVVDVTVANVVKFLYIP